MAMLQTQGFSHRPRVLLHRRNSDPFSLRLLELDLEIIALREDVSPESLTHCQKRQRLTGKTRRIERYREFHQLGAALTFVLEALKGFLEPLQVLYQDIATRLVLQFRVIALDGVESFLQRTLQRVGLRVRQLANANDVRPRLGLGKSHSRALFRL